MTIQKDLLTLLLKEQQVKKNNKTVFSSYVQGDLKAETIKINGSWGCDYYSNSEFIKTEVYKGHSELYAENAAENYVFGIKKI